MFCPMCLKSDLFVLVFTYSCHCCGHEGEVHELLDEEEVYLEVHHNVADPSEGC
jgi:hypothetical protein